MKWLCPKTQLVGSRGRTHPRSAAPDPTGPSVTSRGRKRGATRGSSSKPEGSTAVGRGREQADAGVSPAEQATRGPEQPATQRRQPRKPGSQHTTASQRPTRGSGGSESEVSLPTDAALPTTASPLCTALPASPPSPRRPPQRTPHLPRAHGLRPSTPAHCSPLYLQAPRETGSD